MSSNVAAVYKGGMLGRFVLGSWGIVRIWSMSFVPGMDMGSLFDPAMDGYRKRQ